MLTGLSFIDLPRVIACDFRKLAMSQAEESVPDTNGPGTAVAVKTRPKPPKPKRLRPWQVLLHNDEVNDMLYVVDTIVELTTLNRDDAVQRMLDAHKMHISLLLTTHREHAELLCEQFQSKRLKVTAEPAP